MSDEKKSGCGPVVFTLLFWACYIYAFAWGIPYYEKPGSKFKCHNPYEPHQYEVLEFKDGWTKYSDEKGGIHYSRSIALFFSPEVNH